MRENFKNKIDDELNHVQVDIENKVIQLSTITSSIYQLKLS